MIRMLAALCVFGAAVAVSAHQTAPPPPPPPPAQGGRGAGSGVSGGAHAMFLEAPVVTGTGVVSGVVTDGTTGAPIEGAIVQLSTNSRVVGQASPSRPHQMTDSKGRFIFTDLPASASYSLVASRAGYLGGGYRRMPGVNLSTPLALADGQWFTEGQIKLWRPAAISGTVRDERDEPLVGIPVRLMVGAVLAGRWRFAAGQVTHTDDLGTYRFAGLTRGRYIVHVPSIQISLPSGEVALYRSPNRTAASASPPAADVLPVLRGPDGSGVVAGVFASAVVDDKGSVYASVFHPSARSLDDAEPIVVDFAESRMAVDIQMTPLPSVSVSGTVTGPPSLIGDIPVRIFPTGNELVGLAGDAGVTRTDGTGAFTFHRVPAGNYLIVASRTVSEYHFGLPQPVVPAAANPFSLRFSNLQGSNGMTLGSFSMPGPDVSGRVEVSVGNRSLSGLVVPVIPAVSVSGHFEWDGSETPPSGARAPLIRLEGADGDVSSGPYVALPVQSANDAPAQTITFTVNNVKAGRYELAEMLGNQAYRLIGATWNGRDFLDTPLEVTGEDPITGIVIRMTARNNKVAGTVRGDDGPAAAGGTVIAFPASPAAWGATSVSRMRFRTAGVAADGAYELTSMLTGDYLLAAVTMEDRSRWSDPAFLASIAARATRVTLGPGSTLSQDLRIIGGSR